MRWGSRAACIRVRGECGTTIRVFSRSDASAPMAASPSTSATCTVKLFPFQRTAVTLARHRGRAAPFEDTGLGRAGKCLNGWGSWPRSYRRPVFAKPCCWSWRTVFVRDEARSAGPSW